MAVAESEGMGPIQRPSAAGRLKMPSSPTKMMLQTKEELKKQADRLAQKAEEHEHVINKITYVLGVAMFGTFCFLLGSKPQTIPYLYCLFFLTALPLRWIYYRSKKWHYYLLDFCYYANVIFIAMLLFFPNNDKLFLVCFSFAEDFCYYANAISVSMLLMAPNNEQLYLLCFSFSEGPLAWAIIVWRCSLVFSSIDKIVSVLIHLLPGTVLFIIRWWDPVTYTHHAMEETGPWPAWPVVGNEHQLWMWLFAVPLCVYSIWQMLYWIIVHGLRNQRILNDPEIMTSYRELSRKAARANNVLWRLSGILGDGNRVTMYAVYQGLFTVATLALTVPMFKHYRLHLAFQIFKVSAAIWNGGNFFFDVMPRQVVQKKEMKGGQKIALKKAPESSPTRSDEGQDRPVTPPVDVGPSSSSVLPGTSPFGRAENGAGSPEHGYPPTVCAICRQSSLPNPNTPHAELTPTAPISTSSTGHTVSGPDGNLKDKETLMHLEPSGESGKGLVGGQSFLTEGLLAGTGAGMGAGSCNASGFLTNGCVSVMGSGGEVGISALKPMACAS